MICTPPLQTIRESIVKKAGKYLIVGNLAYETTLHISERTIQLQLNGETCLAMHDTRSNGGHIAMSITTIRHLNVGDYVELRAYQLSYQDLEVLATSYSPELTLELLLGDTD